MEYIVYPHDYAKIFEDSEYYYGQEHIPLGFVILTMQNTYPYMQVCTNDGNRTVSLKTIINGREFVISEDIFGFTSPVDEYTKMIEKLKTITEWRRA